MSREELRKIILRWVKDTGNVILHECLLDHILLLGPPFDIHVDWKGGGKKRRDGMKVGLCSAAVLLWMAVPGHSILTGGLSSRVFPLLGGPHRAVSCWDQEAKQALKHRQKLVLPFCISKGTLATGNTLKDSISRVLYWYIYWYNITQLKDFYFKLRCII